MTYVLTLAEQTTTGTFTVNNIYWNDERMLFGADGYTVTATEKTSTVSIDGITTSTSTISTNLNGLVRCWTYAGGSSSTYQIQGPTSPIAAYTIFDTTNVASTASWAMSDLVFGVIQLEYNSANGVTALPTITYELTNSLSNPGEVWYDYMTSTRYGAGFTATSVNTTTSIGNLPTSLKSISNQNPANQFNAAGDPIFQYRYEINGVLNTGETALANIQKINMASASWTTYDHKLGQWRVVPNRATTSTDTIFAFTDDNIIGDISVTGTNLEDLYNELEVAYPNRLIRDQIDYYRDNIAEVDQNAGEFPNQLSMRTDLCNNNIHAGRVGLMELFQSRADKVVTLTADYSALQVEVGDVISLTNTVYGFVNKLFRVSRVRETEADDGGLAAEITGIEYDPAVYTDYDLYLSSLPPGSGIPPNNGVAIAGRPYVIASFPNPPGPDAPAPYFVVGVNVPANQYGFTTMELFYSGDDSSYSYLAQFSGDFNPGPGGSVATASVSGLDAGDWYFKARGLVMGDPGSLGATSTPKFEWRPV
jgi:hypothetical protein